MQLRAEFFDIVNHPNFSVGPQALSWSSAEVINPTNPNYSQLSNPAAYALPTGTSPGGALCGNFTGACYPTTTAIGNTVPNALGGQREIQFAAKFSF